MNSRKDFNDILKGLGVKVFFNPPETLKLTYPCIVYHLDRIQMAHADDRSYKKDKSYSVTYIHKTPDDDEMIDKITDIPGCVMNRSFVVDNLYHEVFTIIY